MNLTQRELAERADLSKETVVNVEKGHITDPMPLTVAALERGLDLPFGALASSISDGAAEQDRLASVHANQPPSASNGESASTGSAPSHRRDTHDANAEKR